MKNLKSIFFAFALIGATTLPALADEDFAPAGEDMSFDASVNDPTAADHGRDHGRGRDRDHRRPRPRYHVCYASNAARRVFQAAGYQDLRYLQSRAVQSCRARSFGPLRFTCRPAGCR